MNGIERYSWYSYDFDRFICTDKEFWYDCLNTTNTLRYAELAASNSMPVHVESTVANGEQFEGGNVVSKKRGRSVQLCT